MTGLSAGAQAITLASATPLLEIKTSATDYLVVTEISASLYWQSNAATISTYTFGLGTPAAQGLGVANVSAGYDDFGNTSRTPGITILTVWSTPPTVPTNFLRQVSSRSWGGVSGINVPIMFMMPGGIKLAPSSSLVIWTVTASLGGADPSIFDLCIGIDG